MGIDGNPVDTDQGVAAFQAGGTKRGFGQRDHRRHPPARRFAYGRAGPEANPIKQVWAWAKGEIAGEIFETVEDLKHRVNAVIEGAGGVLFKSIVHRQFILDALNIAHI